MVVKWLLNGSFSQLSNFRFTFRFN